MTDLDHYQKEGGTRIEPSLHKGVAVLRFYFFITSIITLIAPHLAFGWGSATGFETHQLIDRLAYERLAIDPTLKDSGFPTLPEILAREGVYYLGDGESLWSPEYVGGPGPDRPGASDDSDHYYNPTTGKGTAPAAAARYYRYIAQGLHSPSGSAEAVKKSAAWGAHYIADMSVPYHGLGMPKSELMALYSSLGGPGAPALNLDPPVTGNRVLLSYNLKEPHSQDFKLEAERFLREATKPENAHMNWFDPWYWNGIVSQTKGSSHIEWEMTVSHAVSFSLFGYSPDWRNAPATFADPWSAQAPQVAAMAMAAAGEALSFTPTWIQDANDAINRSAQNVLTMWRASISALRPELKIEAEPPDQMAGEDQNPVYKLTGVVKNVTLEDTAKNVRLRVTILSGANFVEGDEEAQSVPDISSGGFVEGGEWKIEVTDRKVGAQLKVEVIADYVIPDLQYASKTVAIKIPEFDGVYEGTFLGASGSSGKISFTVSGASVQGSFSGVYDGSPTEGQFQGTIDASGAIDTKLNGVIHAEGFNNQPWDIAFAGELTGRVNGVTGTGSWVGRNNWGQPQGTWSVSKVSWVPPSFR